jgi:nitrogen fixation protein FixH
MSQEEPKSLIPAHILWPGLVVGLLLFSVGTQVVLLQQAKSDGGEQIEADYYKRAVGWDERRAREEASDALGWQVEVRAGSSLRLVFKDLGGAPVEGLEGEVSLRRPQLAAPVGEGALEAVPGAPGVYQVPAPQWQPGLWDVQIEARRGGAQFLRTVRYEHAPTEG